jgi:uncharacterized protein involved in exopolysaccharide biosynthesis
MSGDNLVSRGDGRPGEGGERIVYVMPSDCLVVPPDDSASFVSMLAALWRGKWRIAAITFLFAAAGVAYALLATEWYRANAVLAPAEKKTMPDLLGSLGGLASLAGVSIGGGGSEEPLAVLRSREFTTQFIEDLNLTTVLLADKWDADEKRWKASDPEDWPDVRDAVTYFDKYVRSAALDKKTGMVTLTIRWKDPVVAADWANLLVTRLNDRMRARALADATRNVQYLQSEIANTSVVSLQQSIGRVLETEMQRLMLARGNPEFAFRVIDPAKPPRKRSEPQRVRVVVMSTILGFAVSIAMILIVPAIRARWPAE